MPLRVGFMGTPDFAAAALTALIGSRHQVVAVYSQPPRPAGRGQKEQPSPVHLLAEAHAIPVHTPARLRGQEEQAAFRALNLDVAVVAAYGLILPQAILDAPRFGCLNIHASLLPRWRGAAPIQRAILAGDTETGITIMQMDAGLDTGPMLLRATTPITDTMTGGALHDALAAQGAGLILEALDRLEAGTLHPVVQPEDGVTYAQKIDKAELRLDWSRPAVEVDRQVRAFAPRPGAWTEWNGERIKILSAEVEERAHDAAPGTCLDDRLLVACGIDALRLTRLQRAGKAPLPAEDVLRGLPMPAGSRFV